MKKKIVINVKLEGREKVDMPSALFKMIRQYVSIISIFFGNLTPRQQDLVAALLYLDNKYREEIPNDKLRWEVIMSKEGKDQIKGIANLGDANFHNNLSSLRKVGIFVNNTLIPSIRIYPKGTFTLSFEFNEISE